MTNQLDHEIEKDCQDILVYFEDLMVSKEVFTYFNILKISYKEKSTSNLAISIVSARLFAYTLLRCYELAFSTDADAVSVNNFIKNHGLKIYKNKDKSKWSLNIKFNNYKKKHKKNLEDLRHRVAHTIKPNDSKRNELQTDELITAIDDLKILLKEILRFLKRDMLSLKQISSKIKNEIHYFYQNLYPEQHRGKVLELYKKV